MKINKLVKEMQAHARKHPYKPEDAFRGIFVDEGCMRIEDYKGIRVTFCLSMNDHGDMMFWSLSISGNGMTDKFAQELASHFFDSKNGPVVINPPSPINPLMKQYGQKV